MYGGGVPCLHEWDSLGLRLAHPDRSTGGKDNNGSGVFVAGRNQPAKAARGEAFDFGETCVRCGAWRGWRSAAAEDVYVVRFGLSHICGCNCPYTHD